jgi:hypothetical protein
MKLSKFTTIFLSFIFAISSLKAQDIITLKTGEDLKAKIMEIGLNDVKYKKFENLNGPTYTLNKSDIFMIKYENGTKDVFNTTTSAPAPQPSSGYPSNGSNNETVVRRNDDGYYHSQTDYDANMKLYRSKLTKGIVMTSIGAPLLIAGFGLVGYGASVASDYYSSNYPELWAPELIVGTLFVITGIPLTIAGPINIGRAFHYRSEARKSKTSMSFEPIFKPLPFSNGNFAGGMSMKIKF